MIIDRMYVIQEVIKKIHSHTYLEIGIHEGECFLRIRCRQKIAVDPHILIPPAKKRKYYLRNIFNLFNRYYQMSSDDFFHQQHAFLLRNRPDVVFIDGLHRYDQSLRDVQNALRYLKDDGVIIMHDCNPLSEAAAFPARSCEHAASMQGFSGEWNGDVWKTIVHLRSSRKDIDVFVLDCDQGLGVITKRKPEHVLTYSIKDLQALSYIDLDRNRKYLLNLKSSDYFFEFLNTL
jgi:hypothetical protein